MYLEQPEKKTGAKKFICVFFCHAFITEQQTEKKYSKRSHSSHTKKEKLMRSESDLGIFVLVSQ